jgi:LysR family glycine cleavage system transcriptional activator
MSNIPLNPLRTFCVASRHSTFTDAARTLGVTQVAVSRQVSVLEKYLNTRLFDRDLNSVRLTEAGQAFSRKLLPLFDDIETTVMQLRERERDDVVSLCVYPTFCKSWLLPRMVGILGATPKFSVRFDTRVVPLDFRKEFVDVAIQLGTGEWPGAKSRLLFPEVLDAVCSPGYAEWLGASSESKELPQGASLLHAKYRRREWDRWAEMSGWNIENAVSIDFQSSILSYEAAEHGLGLSMAQLPLIDAKLVSGELVQPFQAPQSTGQGFYIVWPTITSVAPSTKLFIDRALRAAGQAAEFNTNPA